MTDAVAIALVGGLPLTLAAIGGLYVQLTTRGKVEVIEGHVNSEKTELLGRISTKDAEIALLREIIADKKLSAGLLAQAAAGRSTVPATTSPEAVESLQKIDDNTAATATNTKR